MKKHIVFYFLFIQVVVKANISLPAVLSSNMVLQQQSPVLFWGWGEPTRKVFITPSWSNHTDSVVVGSDGKWHLRITTPTAGGPFSILLKENNTITLNNILIGEVWVCSGQSNMEMNYHWGLPDVKAELPDAANQNIRFFSIPKTTALYPQENCRGVWTICDSNELKNFSAVAYFFGKRLNQKLKVPIGLIHASWGGTPAESWTSASLIDTDSFLKEANAKIPESKSWPVVPGLTFNGMIAPITRYNIAGAIWYQGEGNTAAPYAYDRILKTMIGSWRTEWKKEFPFYYVQIAPYVYGNYPSAALLREAQTKVSSLNKTGMVVISDLVDDVRDIHPKNKHDVGLRLANLALEQNYNQPLPAKSPLYQSLKTEKDKAFIFFEPEENVVIKGPEAKELLIAGDDRIFYPAKAKADKGKLIVWSQNVKRPVAVRYSFSNAGIGNLFGANGLPVSPFRTDDWEIK